MNELPAFGVDVTAVAIRGAKLERGPDGQPRLVAWDVIDFAEHVDDITSLRRFQSMARGLYAFRSRHDLGYAKTWVSLRAETAFNRTVVVPPVNDESLDRLLGYEAQQQVPFPLDEVYWDRRVLAIRENGEVLATIYAIKKSVVDDRVRKLAKAGLRVDGVQLRPIALQNFCAFERLLEPGTVVVDVDYAGLQIIIHHEEQSWFRVLPVGGMDFVDVVAKTFGCPHERAVKIATGDLSPPNAAAFEACQRKVAQQIADEAARTVRYYAAARPEVRPSGIVLFESHRTVPPMAAALKKALELPVFKPKGFRHLEVDPDVVTAGIQEHFASLAKAVGLALQGIGKAEVDARLYSLDLAAEPVRRRHAGLVFASALLLAVVGLVGWRHRGVATEVEEGIASLDRVVASGTARDDIERRVKPGEPFQAFDALVRPGVGRDALIEIHDHVVRTLATPSPQGRIAHLAAFRFDRLATSTGEGEIVLYAPAAGDSAGIDRALDDAAAGLVDQRHVAKVSARDGWTAGQPTAEPPAAAANEPLRFLFRHRRYAVVLGGVGP